MSTTLDINHLHETTRAVATEVFGTMLGVALEFGTPIQSLSSDPDGHVVMSFIGLTGYWTGSSGLSCSATSACRIASHMMLSEYKEVNEEVCDALGEITNMIVGNLKNSIIDHTGPLAISTPNVVSGRDIVVGKENTNESMVFPFIGPDFTFRVMVRLIPPTVMPVRKLVRLP